jgi:hypothetical protein
MQMQPQMQAQEIQKRRAMRCMRCGIRHQRREMQQEIQTEARKRL